MTTKNILSLLTVIIFLFLAIASSNSKLLCGDISTINSTKSNSDNRNYVIKNDGTKIYGKAISFDNLTTLRTLTIDSVKFSGTEIKEIMSYGTFYLRKGKNEFIQRIIQGKINVYKQSRHYENAALGVTSTGGTIKGNFDLCKYYIQKGDGQELSPLKSVKDVKKLVSNCPEALKLFSDKQYKDATVYDVFVAYSKNCNN